MLTKVEVVTDQGTSISFPFREISEGYYVRDISGLDPVKASISTTNSATRDGDQYQSSRRESRNLILKMGLDTSYITSTVESLRRRLYQYFMPKSAVRLRFHFDVGPAVDIIGRVESFESPIFSQDQESTISVMCFDSDFFIPTPEVFNGVTTSTLTESLISYDGSIETGIVLTITMNRAVSEFTITNRAQDGSVQTMEFDGSLLSGDKIVINTNPGQKGVFLTRTTTQSSFLYGLAPTSTWIKLYPGDNYIRVSIPGAGIAYSVSYTSRFGGL